MARWLSNIAAAVLITLLVAVLVYVARQRQLQEQRVDQTVESIRRMEETLKVQAAAGQVTINARGWPVTIEPAWFAEPIPRNYLLTGDRPWLEVAGPESAEQRHPAMRQAVNTDIAEFWYNPAQGVIRARVPVTVSDAEAAELYNRVNTSNLRSIFEVEPPARRTGPATAAAGTAEPDR